VTGHLRVELAGPMWAVSPGGSAGEPGLG
jgi:hypothetical protein